MHIQSEGWGTEEVGKNWRKEKDGEKGDKKSKGALLQVSWGVQQRALQIQNSLQGRKTILHLIHLSAQVCKTICDQNFTKVALFCWFFFLATARKLYLWLFKPFLAVDEGHKVSFPDSNYVSPRCSRRPSMAWTQRESSLPLRCRKSRQLKPLSNHPLTSCSACSLTEHIIKQMSTLTSGQESFPLHSVATSASPDYEKTPNKITKMYLYNLKRSY